MSQQSEQTPESFGAMLAWHLERTPRPDGKGLWTQETFGRAVEVSDRMVRKWIAGTDKPARTRLHTILVALFGPAALEKGRAKELAELWAAGTAPAAPDLSIPGPCLGRDTQIAELVALLVRADSYAVTVVVLGGPGYGKTLLTEAVVAHPDIIARFGPRRFFLKLETIRTAREIEVSLAAALGLDPHTRFDVVLARLAEAGSLVTLDNLETPWEADRVSTEALLHRLAAVPRLALMVSARGEEQPPAPWTRVIWLPPLPEPAARALFLLIAQRIDPADPDLPFFLAERTGVLGGIPLAVTLVARRAGLEGSLSVLRRRWAAAGVTLAARLGPAAGRLDSVVVSIGLSLGSPRLGPEGRRLFALLGRAPAGLAEQDGAALLGSDWIAAADQLRAVGLLAPGERCDLLPPVRDFAGRTASPADEDARAWRRHILDLVRAEGSRFSKPGGAEALQRLVPEMANIDAALDAAISAGDLGDSVSVVGSLGDLFRFSGFGTVAALYRLTTACQAADDTRGAAAATFYAGLVAFARSDHAQAWACYEAALTLYRAVGDKLGEANCIWGFGNIAQARTDYAEACARYKAALSLYSAVGGVLGGASCIKNLGDIALERSEHAQALKHYEAALPLCRAVGDVQGEANCIQRVGDIALRRSDHSEARVRYTAALPLYRAVGDVQGEANCICGLGEIARAEGDAATARSAYVQALGLYDRIGNLHNIGRAHQLLADVTDGDARVAHLAAARAARGSIDRPDPVAKPPEE